MTHLAASFGYEEVYLISSHNDFISKCSGRVTNYSNEQHFHQF